jgi:hypothetical protein
MSFSLGYFLGFNVGAVTMFLLLGWRGNIKGIAKEDRWQWK